MSKENTIESPKKRRDKGDGSLFKNGNNKWVGRYNGKEFTAATKSEAKSKLEHYKMLVTSNNALSKNYSVKQYGEKYLFHKQLQVARKKFKETSYDRLEATYYNQILTHKISNVHMSNLTGRIIQEFIDDLIPKYSLSTIRKTYLFLHAMITFGVENDDLPRNYDPMKLVELPDEKALTIKTKSIEIIPDNQLDSLIQTAMATKDNGSLLYRYGPLITFGLNTGLRECELLALSRKNIIKKNNGKKEYHVKEGASIVKNRDSGATTKTKYILTTPKYPNSFRSVPLNNDALRCLNLMISRYGPSLYREDLIVSTKNGWLPTKRNLQNAFDSILRSAGLPHYGLHSLRHTFATRLLKRVTNQQELKEAAEIIGDDYNVIVSTYLHTDELDKAKLIDSLCS